MNDEVGRRRLVAQEVPRRRVIVLGCVIIAGVLRPEILEGHAVDIPIRFHVGERCPGLCVDAMLGFEGLSRQEVPRLVDAHRKVLAGGERVADELEDERLGHVWQQLCVLAMCMVRLVGNEGIGNVTYGVELHRLQIHAVVLPFLYIDSYYGRCRVGSGDVDLVHSLRNVHRDKGLVVDRHAQGGQRRGSVGSKSERQRLQV